MNIMALLLQIQLCQRYSTRRSLQIGTSYILPTEIGNKYSYRFKTCCEYNGLAAANPIVSEVSYKKVVTNGDQLHIAFRNSPTQVYKLSITSSTG